jgi:hypothetical protein
LDILTHIFVRNGTPYSAPASNKAHGKQNNIPTLYILEIDSSVFKSVQVSSIVCRFVQKIKN